MSAFTAAHSTSVQRRSRATATSHEACAAGSIVAWVGRVEVVASAAGVRSVALPRWSDQTLATADGIGERHLSASDDCAAARHLSQALDELGEYFAGERQAFSVALDLHGGAFMRAAWAAVARVPYGETRTYSDIARAIGAPLAVRAVGAANGANPVAPFVPCHRIVGSNGALTGYGPGLPLKQRLLVFEGAIPAAPDSYDAWIAHVQAGMPDSALFLGNRRSQTYCHTTCPLARRGSLLPGRSFATPEAAQRAGFHPCPTCRPE